MIRKGKRSIFIADRDHHIIIIKMASSPPEKVKELLSSFLVKAQDSTSETDPYSSPSTPVRPPSGGQRHRSGEATGSGALRSYDQFLLRVDTFSPVTWFSKPVSLSPLECARYGWNNVDTDMLMCVGCKACLSGRLTAKTDQPAYEEGLAKLKESLVTAHDKFCVIAANPCPEHFSQVPCHDPGSLLSSFTERVSALEALKDRLPHLDYTLLNQQGYDEGQMGAYCKRHLMPEREPSLEVVTLAVTGWTTSQTCPDVLNCPRCRRQVGLWNFTSRQDSTSNLPDSTCEEEGEEAAHDEDSDEEQPSAKRRKMMLQPKQRFEPLEEHRHWCPLLQATSAPTTRPGFEPRATQGCSVPAWRAALQAIAPGLMDGNTGLAHTMKTSPMTEGLRCFRRVLKGWSSPKTKGPHVEPVQAPS